MPYKVNKNICLANKTIEFLTILCYTIQSCTNMGDVMIVKNNEQGNTMIQTIMYICILIALSTAIAKNISGIFGRYKTGRLAQQVVELKKSIIQFSAVDEDYTTVSEEALETSKSLPLDMRNLRHALGGVIEFGPTTEITGSTPPLATDRYMYYITFKSIHQPACIEILSHGQFFTDGSELDTIIINRNIAWNYRFSQFSTSHIANVRQLQQQYLSISEAISSCNRKVDNEITWIFT